MASVFKMHTAWMRVPS